MPKSSRKTRRLLVISTITVLGLFTLPIKVKEAIEVRVSNEVVQINKMDAKMVSLLCKPLIDDDKWPKIDKYEIIAIENNDEVFNPVLYDGFGVPMVYISKNNFVGGAIKSYNYGFNNCFIFRGELSVVDGANSRQNITDYNLKLDSWDVVYPVHHWEFCIAPDNEFYKRNLFIFDYLIP